MRRGDPEKNDMKQPAIYMVTNKRNGTLYIGVTSDLIKRVYQHKEKIIAGFTKKYGCIMLGYYEIHCSMEAAIIREKQLKDGPRRKKLQLIESMNPEWLDLYYQLI